MAVVFFNKDNFEEAREYLGHALSLCHCESIISANSNTYETILLNLAHCHRKLKNYGDAI
jgi:hypothetical protein